MILRISCEKSALSFSVIDLSPLAISRSHVMTGILLTLRRYRPVCLQAQRRRDGDRFSRTHGPLLFEELRYLYRKYDFSVSARLTDVWVLAGIVDPLQGAALCG